MSAWTHVVHINSHRYIQIYLNKNKKSFSSKLDFTGVWDWWVTCLVVILLIWKGHSQSWKALASMGTSRGIFPVWWIMGIITEFLHPHFWNQEVIIFIYQHKINKIENSGLQTLRCHQKHWCLRWMNEVVCPKTPFSEQMTRQEAGSTGLQCWFKVHCRQHSHRSWGSLECHGWNPTT